MKARKEQPPPLQVRVQQKAGALPVYAYLSKSWPFMPKLLAQSSTPTCNRYRIHHGQLQDLPRGTGPI